MLRNVRVVHAVLVRLNSIGYVLSFHYPLSRFALTKAAPGRYKVDVVRLLVHMGVPKCYTTTKDVMHA